MKLTILGSGSPEAYARRASSGYMLEVGGDTVLFDCGGGVFDNLLRAGKRPGDITHLYFTHLHSDHMMDYARLVHAAWDEGAAPLRVFGPAPLAGVTDRLFGTDGVFAHDLAARTEVPQSKEVWVRRGGTLPRAWPQPVVTEIGPDHRHDHGGWQISTCEVPHAQPWLDCFAFAVAAEGRRFVYSGDAGPSAKLTAMACGADLLLHWCYRLDIDPASAEMMALSPSPQEIVDMATASGVKRVLLTHFRRHMDASFDPARVHSTVDWSVAEDLDTYVI
ncbi:MBL fold metallo-hydrolase [uncultured Tateyamaria sp.]|uniref:MBL fold metallo-hydrolase n=1 Tax=uncultured Tateyamaria sp. TaxID=455651 RepID=UPI00261C033F|nr:MBL fold metallo-hydrolase [uncultured Tateyamaria sp.]